MQRHTYIRKHRHTDGSRSMLAGFIVVLCLLLAQQLPAHPLSAPSAPPRLATLAIDSTFYGHYPFLRFIDTQEDASLVRLSDEEFLDKAGKVVFKVNTYDTFTNDSLLQLLEKEIIPRINKDSLRLRRLIVRGAASPEGAVPNNRMLSRRRTETLTSFLRAHLSVPVEEQSFTTEVVSEDYRLLLVMMQRANDPALGIVRSLCDRHLPRYEYTILKRKLQQLQGGILWRHLFKEYFPELRAARVVLVFDKPEIPVIPENPESPESPESPEIPEIEAPLAPGRGVGGEAAPIRVPRREVLAVKTNMLLYGVYMPSGYDKWCPIPNVAVEVFPLHGHFTYGASIDFPWWRNYWGHKYFEVRNYQLEARYYFRSGDVRLREPGEGIAFRGWYLQGYAHAAMFCICFDKDRGWKGEALGAGLGAGYVLPLGKKSHWRLEFSLQAGFMYGGYDPFQFENPVNPNYQDHLYYYKWTGKPADFKRRQYRFSWLGPTRVGITLSYDLLYLRWKKKGVSLKPSEMAK
ncbi:MAG: DUF3575 domain-containing protein [Bacteroidaceae bacterium]|nr:DUF3575 domain-containing protein [Bacteroidaceae bacterium]